MLGKLSYHEIGKRWPQVVTDVEFAINNSINLSTNETPCNLLFGINQRGKTDDNIVEYLNETVNNCTRNLAEMRTKASEHIQKAQNVYIENANAKRRKPTEYKEGDYVMVRNFDTTKGVSPKLVPRFKGPYVIIKALRNQRYILADIEGCQVTQKKYEGVCGNPVICACEFQKCKKKKKFCIFCKLLIFVNIFVNKMLVLT